MNTNPEVTPTRVYFRPTTAQQRRYLFAEAEATGNVTEAARRAHTGRGTYYYWRDRQQAAGTAGLTQERSRAPHQPRLAPVSAALRAEVLAYHDGHPTAGYRSIANALRQAHDWEPVISHTKVGELLREQRQANPTPSLPAAPAAAGADNRPPDTPALPPPQAYRPGQPAVHAPQAQQAVNIDLCVVPVTHQGQALPVGSVHQAGEGLLPTPPVAPTPPDWAGQAFQDDTQPYEEQMREYTTRRAQKRASQGQRKHRRRQKQAERAALNAQELELRLQRRRQRQRRRAEDHTWRARRATQRQAEQTHRQQSRAERRQHRAERRAQRAAWQAAKATRHAQLQERQTEDATWRQARQTLREQRAHLAALPLVVAWYAILVVVDNGTRQCYGVPLFLVGVQVTADMIVAALRECLPPHLHFLISDNDARFLAAAFTQFLADQQIEHVRIPPHHPCTNGIAERFVRTLKEWLTPHPWNSPEELQALLTEFQTTYNDRPHQGRELAGLSPNEFARRLADCSTS